MIQANELRIGNKVFDEDNQSYVEVNELKQCMSDSPYDITLKYPSGMYAECNIEDIKPIPLTEEWLIKFDYVLLTDVGYYHRVKGTNKMDSSIYINDGKFYSDSLYEKEIKYVHTLQNYYYFNKLTGEELTMK